MRENASKENELDKATCWTKNLTVFIQYQVCFLKELDGPKDKREQFNRACCVYRAIHKKQSNKPCP